MTVACRQAPLCCGPFTAGEIPDPIVYTFLTADGAPIDLTGATARFCWRERWGASAEADAVLDADPTSGRVAYQWAAGDLAAPGRYTAQFWVDQPGTYASVPIRFDVEAAVCEAVA